MSEQNTTFRIERFDANANCWSVARLGRPSIESARAELNAMLAENPKSKLRIVKVSTEVVVECGSSLASSL